MKLTKVKTLECIKPGDTLIITGDTHKNKQFTAQIVKVTPVDGTEIIIDKAKNIYFNLGMYLDGKSWVKEVKILS